MIEDKSSLHSIEAALKDLRAALSEQILRLEQTFKTSSGDIISKVAERKAFAKKLGLDKRLTEIWEEMRSIRRKYPFAFPYRCQSLGYFLRRLGQWSHFLGKVRLF